MGDTSASSSPSRADEVGATLGRAAGWLIPTSWSTVLMALAVWAIGTALTLAIVKRNAQLRDMQQASSIARAAEGLLRQYELLLNLSRTAFEPGIESPGLTIRSLVFGDMVQRDHPGVTSISFIRRVSAQQLRGYERSLGGGAPLSEDGLPASQLRPAPGRQEHFFLEATLPPERSAGLRGTDMQSDALVNAAMRRALAANAPVILAHELPGFSSLSAPVMIAPSWAPQDKDGAAGLLGFLVLRMDTGRQFQELTRRELPEGWALCVELEPEAATDGAAALPGAELYTYNPHGAQLEESAAPLSFRIGASRLQLMVKSDDALDAAEWTTLALGSMAALLAALLIATLVNRENRRRAMAMDYAAGRDRSARVIESRFRDIVESSRDWIWETDNEDRFTYLSPNTRELLGIDPRALLGTAAGAIEEHPGAGNLAPGTRERKLRHSTGRLISMESSAVHVFDEAGKVTGLRGIDRDISARRVVQDRLSRLRQDIAMSTRSNLAAQLLSGVAHELNQPLAAIAAYNQACMRLLRSGTADMDEIMRAMEASANSAVLAGDVLKRLRAVSRAGELMAEVVEVRDIVDNALALLDYRINQTRTRMDVGLEPGLPPLYADPVLLLQVVLNVLNNALDAVSQAADPRIAISARRGKEGKVEISVSDNGPGIEPAMRERVFESAFTTKLHGSGLGLPISRSIAEAHDGTLVIEDALGGGTRVVLTMRGAAD